MKRKTPTDSEPPGRAKKHNTGNSKLLEEIKEGKVEEIDKLLQNGTEINFQDSDGNSCLHFAAKAKQNSAQVVLHLLKKGADVLLENRDHKTLFDVAFKEDKEGVVCKVARWALWSKADDLAKSWEEQKKKGDNLSEKQKDGKNPEFGFIDENEEIDNLMEIFWRPYDSARKNIKICITFSYLSGNLKAEQYFRLIWTDSQTPFFRKRSEVQLNVDELNCKDSMYVPCDSINSALRLALLFCERISSNFNNVVQHQKGRTNTEVGLNDEWQNTVKEIDNWMKILWPPSNSKKIKSRVPFSYLRSNTNTAEYLMLTWTDSQKPYFTRIEEQLDVNELKNIPDLREDGDGLVLISALKLSLLCFERESSNFDDEKNQVDKAEKSSNVLAEAVKDDKYLVDWEVLFKNVIHEVKRTLEKTKWCLSNCHPKRNISYADYETANILIFFIETLAVQDTHPVEQMTKTRAKTFEKRLTVIKREYFKRCYQKCLEDKTIDVPCTFSIIREKFLKNSLKFEILPETIIKFFEVKKGGSPFEMLEVLTRTLVRNLEKRKTKEFDSEHQTAFKSLQKKAQESIKAAVADSDTIIQNFCEDVKKLQTQDQHSILQKLMFNCIVNLYPILYREGQPLRDFGKLRNDIIHNFYNLSSNSISQKMRSAVKDLYRYDLASILHDSLKTFRGDKFMDEQLELFERDASEKMKTLGKRYGDLKIPVFRASAFASLEDDWQEKVGIYVDCVAPIVDYCKFDEGDDIVSSRRHDTIHIFESFDKILALSKVDKDDRSDSERLLLIELEKSIGWVRTVAVKNALKNRPNDVTLKEAIANEVRALLHLKKHDRRVKDKLSNQNVITLFEGFLTNPYSSFDMHVEKSGLSSKTQQEIEKKIKLIITAEPIELKWGETVYRVRKSTMVLNLLKYVNKVHQTFPLQFNTVQDAFNDHEVITYLIEKEFPRKQGNATQYVLPDPFRVLALNNVKYLAAFITSIFIKTRNFSIFRNESSMKGVFEALLQDASSVSYIGDLTALKDQRVTDIMFDITATQEVSEPNGTLIVVGMRKNIEEEQGAYNIKEPFVRFKENHKGDSEIIRKAEQKIMKIAHKAVLNKIQKKNSIELDDAQKLMDEISTLDSAHSHNDHKLLNAKLLLERGRYKRDGTERKTLFDRALGVLNEIIQDKDKTDKIHMLALSRLAYGYRMLAFEQEKDAERMYGKAYRVLEESLKILWKIVNDFSSFDISVPSDCLTIFNKSNESQKYKDFMQDGEFWKYCSVLKIWKEMASVLALQVQKGLWTVGIHDEKAEPLLRSITMYYEVYDLTPKQKDGFETRLRVAIQKQIAKNYESLAFLYENHLKDEKACSFYTVKQLELLLMCYSASLKCFGEDQEFINYCYLETEKCKERMIKQRLMPRLWHCPEGGIYTFNYMQKLYFNCNRTIEN